MSGKTRSVISMACMGLILYCASPVRAQLESQLSAYTGANASGYLAPLIDAFGADLNAATFHTAHIPKWGLNVSLELRYSSVRFSESDRVFNGTTENDFSPVTIREVPTVVGDRRAVFVDGDGGTRYAFPGGFDLSSFSMIVPQLRIGSLYGTEALIRYFYFNLSREEFGSFNIFGFGLRHSISQYFDKSLPVDVAFSFFWQQFSLDDSERGDDLVTADALTAGLHVSRRFKVFEPYAGITYDKFDVDVSYQSESDLDSIDLSFDSGDALHLTFGVSYQLAFMAASGEYNIGNQNAFSFGLAFQFRPIQ